MQVPPARLLPARPTRAAPYIDTEHQIQALLAAADQLHPAIRAATFHTLIALMFATGIGTGEALSLDVATLDRAAATLPVTGKYGKTRLLPPHPSVANGLIGYLDTRARLLPAGACPALLISSTGRRLPPSTVHPTFRTVANAAGLKPASTHPDRRRQRPLPPRKRHPARLPPEPLIIPTSLAQPLPPPASIPTTSA